VQLLPKPIKTVIVDGPVELPVLVASLLTLSIDDEKILNSAAELGNFLSSRVSTSSNKNELVGQRVSSSSYVSSSLFDAEAIQSLLANEETRKLIFELTPGLAALGKRLDWVCYAAQLFEGKNQQLCL
jgi:hypothetical protein